MGGLAVGRLEGDPRTKCLWIVSTKDPAERRNVKWPSKFKIVGDPLRLVNERGEEVARVGDLVHIGGGAGDASTRIEPECRVGRYTIIAHEVERVASPS
ncbi:MAG: hypothetical protein ACRDTM_02245 [Micromonosporaceae bacterium]